MTKRFDVNLYTDGGADPNPGQGGYGAILKYKQHVREYSQGYILTTNNRMELLAVISGLEQLKEPSNVNIYSDSKYVVDGIEKGWAKKWRSKGWMRTSMSKAVNADLWARLLELTELHHTKFNWVKGHNGHPENERCDELATLALNSTNLLEDTGYIEQEPTLEHDKNNQTTTKVKGTAKVKKEGDLCQVCQIPVQRKDYVNKKIKKGQSYYFSYALVCPNCKKVITPEIAKVMLDTDQSSLF